jgi:hypothetical protein
VDSQVMVRIQVRANTDKAKNVADVRVTQQVVSGFSPIYANWFVAWDT